MRFAKLFMVSCAAVLFGGALFTEGIAADGNARHRQLVTDGGEPLPQPPPIAQGSRGRCPVSAPAASCRWRCTASPTAQGCLGSLNPKETVGGKGEDALHFPLTYASIRVSGLSLDTVVYSARNKDAQSANL